MSGLWCEHFQEYDPTLSGFSQPALLDGVFAIADGWQVQTAIPPRPGASYLWAAWNTDMILRRIFGAPKSGAGWGGRFFLGALPAHDSTENGGTFSWAFLAQNGYAQMVAFIGSDGSLIIARGPWSVNASGFTVIGRTLPCITARSWNYVELKCVPDDTTGTFEIRVNGVTVYNYTGNTDPMGTGEVSHAQFTGFYNSTGVADLHAWDTTPGNGPSDFVGNVAVFRRELDADTTQADWAKSSGSTGYSLLIDKDDSTYVEADTTGLKSAFSGADLPAGVTGILYQQVKFRGQKTNAADCDVAPSMISTASDETTVTGQPMTTLETWRWGIFGDDPHTSAPWTLAAANASQAAITRTL